MRNLFEEPGIYAIQVAGEVDESWSDRLGGMTMMKTESAGEDAGPVTVLIGLLADQASLAGVLDTLYESRYTLLCVKYLGSSQSAVLKGKIGSLP
jgi:hypothetical protein